MNVSQTFYHLSEINLFQSIINLYKNLHELNFLLSFHFSYLSYYIFLEYLFRVRIVTKILISE